LPNDSKKISLGIIGDDERRWRVFKRNCRSKIVDFLGYQIKVRGDGIEPPTRGFSVLREGILDISQYVLKAIFNLTLKEISLPLM
jgi:hypothetical protein